MADEFESYVEEALQQIPNEFREKIDNVGIFVEDYPTVEQARKFQLREKYIMLFGLYEGIPKHKRGRYGIGTTVPDKITLFRIPILEISRTKAELIKNIKDTLYHELGHHFGMSEREIRRAQKGPA